MENIKSMETKVMLDEVFTSQILTLFFFKLKNFQQLNLEGQCRRTRKDVIVCRQTLRNA